MEGKNVKEKKGREKREGKKGKGKMVGEGWGEKSKGTVGKVQEGQ